MLTGCNTQPNSKAESETEAQPISDGRQPPVVATPPAGPTAAEILRDLRALYGNAKTYADEATLTLSYRLEGQLIHEPQPWSVIFDRSGRLSCRLFNGHVQANGELLGCYVFDIESANLNNQHLVIPYQAVPPIQALFRDPIAKHFLAGFSELPLDESSGLQTPRLVPPTISLLTGQVPNGWLQNPTSLERWPDQVVDGRACYFVRCESATMTADVWIDQATGLMVQMSLPAKLLDPKIFRSPEVTEPQLLARFSNATIDRSLPANSKNFDLVNHRDEIPVRKFVSLPEPLPSELVGRPAPDFELLTPAGEKRNRLYYDGKTTALLFLAGESSLPAVEKLAEIASKFSSERFRFGIVYSDSELSPAFQKVISNSSVPALYDPQLQTSKRLRIKTVPSMLVFDGEATVQFARSLSDERWIDEVHTALQRIDDGENLGREMKTAYDRYLDSYNQQLATVSAADLVGVPQSTTMPVSHQRTSRSSIRIAPELAWTNKSFKQPGNIVVCTGDQSILIFDGWRTVVELSLNGEVVGRHELDLPEGVAVNRIRSTTTAAQGNNTARRLLAVFGKLGNQVYLFDQDFKAIGSFPQRSSNPTATQAISTDVSIRDCQFTDVDGDGTAELVIAFDSEDGITLLNPLTLAHKQVSGASATSVTQVGADLVLTGAGKIGLLKTGLTNVEETELEFTRVGSKGETLCAIGKTVNGDWNAVGFTPKLKRTWTLAIGSQFFESDLEPLAGVEQVPAGLTVWAIADTQQLVHLVSGDGKWLGNLGADASIGGVALAENNGNMRLIVANGKVIECWDLNLSPSD